MIRSGAPVRPTEREEAPLLVLGSGQRCGSTLIQRLLNSHPDILVWGEHGGLLTSLFGVQKRLYGWDEGLADKARNEFAVHGYNGWIANLLPGKESIDDAARSYVRALFAHPAEALGCTRWGFKEVRYGADTIKAMLELFPRTRVIHITRDPRDVLRSLDWWERAGMFTRSGTRDALGHWRKVNQQLLPLRSSPWVLSVRYEDIVAEPSMFAERLARFVDVEVRDLDTNVFAQNVHGAGPEGRLPRTLAPYDQLDPGLRRLLAEPDLIDVAADYGYVVDDEAARPILGPRLRVVSRRLGRRPRR